MTDLASLVVRMQADNSEYIKALDQATSRLNKFQHEQSEALGELATRIGEAFAIEKIVEFSAHAIESAAWLEKFSETTGVSTEALSSLKLAAAASGMSLEDMGTTFKKLNVSLSDAAGNASSKAGLAFRGLGIDVKDAGGNLKDAGTILSELADKFKDMADGPNKVALAVALMGKQGQQMIPILNDGSEGLKKMKEQAEAAGLVISGTLAMAAEDFSRKANVLKSSLVDGLSVQLATQLLPVLNELIDQINKSGSAMDTLKGIASLVVGAVKIITVVVIEAVAEFEQMGKSIGALAAAATAAAHGNFSEAVQIWKDSTAENTAIAESAQRRIEAILEAGSANELAIISTTEAEKKRIKDQGPNLKELEENDKAIKSLEKFRDTLREQAASFDLGGAALTRFKLSIGSLKDDLDKAGPAAAKLKAEIMAAADELQTKKDNKAIEGFTEAIVKQIVTLDQGALATTNYQLHTGELGKALDRAGVQGENYRKTILAVKAVEIAEQDAKGVQAVADEMDRLTGNTTRAALAQFDLQHKMLATNLAAEKTPEGDAGLQKIADLRKEIEYKEQINDLNIKAATINSELAEKISRISTAQSLGRIGFVEASNQEEAARAKAIEQLQQIYTQEDAISKLSQNPALVDGVRKFGDSIDQLHVQMNKFEDSVRTGMEGAFAHNFADLITGAKTFKQAILGFLQDIDRQFADMIAKDYAQKLFAGASGGSAGGALGGLPGMLAGLFGSSSGGDSGIASTGAAAAGTDTGALASSIGGFAGGGTIPAGSVGVVGEDGPELAYSGSKDMQIVPKDSAQARGVSVVNHFTIQSANGTISRSSQMQVAAAAARSLAQASARNNR